MIYLEITSIILKLYNINPLYWEYDFYFS